MSRTRCIANLIIATLVLCATGPSAIAASLNLPDVPLVVSTTVDPNIMLLMDNSGSMSNIIPDTPYDAATTYFTCAVGREIDPADGQVDIRITSTGNPYFRQSPKDYDWGTSGESGSHGAKRCFDPTQSYMARLYGSSGSTTKYPGNYLPASYAGNYLNWYFGSAPANWGNGARKKPNTERRMDSAKTVGKGLVDSLFNSRVGFSTYNGSTGAAINVGVQALDATQKTKLKSAIDALTPSGATPLAESLQDIGRYFVQGYNNTLTLHPGDAVRETTKSAYNVFSHTPLYASGVVQQSPIQYFCQKNFAVLITDGRPQTDQGIGVATGLTDYDGDCPNGNDGTTCLAHDRKVGRSYESYGSDYLDDVAKALYEIDLRPDLDDFDGNEVTNNIITYTVGFADDQVINDPLMQDTADNGGGLFLTASNATQLIASLQKAFADIQDKTSSAASVTLNAGEVSTESRLYQTRLVSGNWSGQLLSLPLDSNGSPQSPEWDARSVLDGQHYDTGRVILTYNPITRQGIPLRWTALDTTQQTLLHTHASGSNDGQGQDRLDYVRGSAAHEGSGNNYRVRPHRLGDLVHSDPFFVGAPAFPDSLGSGYAAFRSAYSNRIPMVYVGANDGMLHGFSATDGREEFAYVPNAVFANLSQLTSATYAHRYYVDGSPTVGDAYGAFGSRCVSGSPCWRTVLVSGLRHGGQGFFALDVTDPTRFTEGNAASLVLWEFSDADHADLGYSFSQPSIVRMANGKWAAVFGNGYNNTDADSHASTSGHAVLYIVFLEGGLDGTWTPGTDFIAIDTGVGDPATPNGLATPAAADVDGDYTVDYIYAGDLHGNLWKFDVSDSDTSNWRVAYSSPLFTAAIGGTPQPITTSPEVGRHPENGVLIYFGTGKYLETTDNSATGVPTQTFYAIWDQNGSTMMPFDRNDLLQHVVVAEVSGTRVTSDTVIDWTVHRGWYLDLPTPGERQVSDSLLRNNRVIFTTLIPNTQICGTGGGGWLMELDAYSGSRLAFPPFDLNGDDKFDDNDKVTITVNGSPEKVPVSGVASTEGILTSPAVLSAGETELKFSSGSSGTISVTTENPGQLARGRQAWRSLP